MSDESSVLGSDEDDVSRVVIVDDEKDDSNDDNEPAKEVPDLSKYENDDEHYPVGHFEMRPELDKKFRTETVREIIHSILVEQLKGQTYTADLADEWVKNISVKIRNKVKELNYRKYKLMVHVVLGEQKGSGVKIASRCLWDADSDGYTFDTTTCSVLLYVMRYSSTNVSALKTEVDLRIL